MMVDELRSPLKRRWMNILAVVLFPIGAVLYLRSCKFHRQIARDLKKTRNTAHTLIERMKKEKLI